MPDENTTALSVAAAAAGLTATLTGVGLAVYRHVHSRGSSFESSELAQALAQDLTDEDLRVELLSQESDMDTIITLHLASDTEANKGLLVEGNAHRAIAQAMKDYSRSERMLEHCVCVLANLASLHANKRLLAKDGVVVQAVVTAMTNFPEATHLQEKGMRTLVSLGELSCNSWLLTMFGASEVILKAMRTHPGSVGIALTGCWHLVSIVSNASDDEEGTMDSTLNGLIGAVLIAMETHRVDAAVVGRGLAALAHVAGSSSREIGRASVLELALRTVRKCMAAHPSDPWIQEVGVLTISRIHPQPRQTNARPVPKPLKPLTLARSGSSPGAKCKVRGSHLQYKHARIPQLEIRAAAASS